MELGFFLKNFFERSYRLFTTPLISVGESSISLLSISKILLSLTIVFFISRGIKFLLKKQVLERLKIEAGNQEAIATIFSYSVGLIGFLVILETTGFNLASLTVIIGGLGVGIGFGLQDVTKNFVSGLTLLLERTVKVGDYIEVDNFSGIVKAVSLRSTLIEISDGKNVIFPNSKLVENRVINWSLENYISRIEIPVKVAYDSDPVLVTEILLDAAAREKSVLKDPLPEVLFKEFGENGLHFALSVWVDRIDRESKITSSLNYAIEYCLRQKGIKIPLPQRDLWIRNPAGIINHSNGKESQEEFYNLVANNAASLRNILPKISYFHNCNELQLRQLIESGSKRYLEAGEVLYRPGDVSDEFYIVLSGSMELIDEKLGKTLRTLEYGDIVGEVAIMLGIPRQITLKATETTTLFAIKAAVFGQLLEDLPGLARGIATDLTESQKILFQHKTYLEGLGIFAEAEERKTKIENLRKRIKNIFQSQRKRKQKDRSDRNKVELKEQLQAGEQLIITPTRSGEISIEVDSNKN